MSLLNNSFLNIYSIIILSIIYSMSRKWHDKASFSNKLFILIMKTTLILLVVDILSRFDGKTNLLYILFNQTGNFLIFLLNPVLVSLWIIYAHYIIFVDKKKVKELIPSLIAVNLLNLFMVILSQFSGWYYHIDQNNIYHRGPLYLFAVSITFALLIVSFFVIASNRKIIEKRLFFPLLFFSVPPFISILLQTRFYGITLILPSVVISLLIVFLNIQNHSMSTDYLTGLYNRKKIEQFLNKMIKESSPQRTFSGVMIDLDNFKKINDSFGHDAGDDALELAGKLLKECIRENDLLARYGGDEFFIVLNISNENTLIETVNRMKCRFKDFNKSCVKPYIIDFSFGSAVYDYSSNMKAEEFLKYLDLLMYKNKQESKGL